MLNMLATGWQQVGNRLAKGWRVHFAFAFFIILSASVLIRDRSSICVSCTPAHHMNIQSMFFGERSLQLELLCLTLGSLLDSETFTRLCAH